MGVGAFSRKLHRLLSANFRIFLMLPLCFLGSIAGAFLAGAVLQCGSLRLQSLLQQITLALRRGFLMLFLLHLGLLLASYFLSGSRVGSMLSYPLPVLCGALTTFCLTLCRTSFSACGRWGSYLICLGYFVFQHLFCFLCLSIMLFRKKRRSVSLL